MATRTTAVLVVGAVAVLVGAACQTGNPPTPRSLNPPVIYVQRSPGWQPIDWTGKPQGLIGSDKVGMPYQSPDGSRVAWQPQGEWQVVDRKGKLLSRLDLSRSRSVEWADDSSGLCVIRQVNDSQPPRAGEYELDFVSATSGASKMLAPFTIAMGPDIAACSPSLGRIVIVSASGYKDPKTLQIVITFGVVRVIDLKAGTVIFSQVLPLGNRSSEVRSIAVSHDGALAALQTEAGTRIVDLTTGTVVRTLDALAPLSFSWDDARLAVSAAPNRGEVIDIATGDPLWTDPVASRVTQGAVANPGDGELMLWVTSGGLNDLVVVSARGTDHAIARNVFTAQVGPCPNCSAF